MDAVAIDTQRLRDWLDRFHNTGLTVVQVLPDAWLLPVSHGGSTIVSLDENYWLRFSPDVACQVDAALLPLLLQKTAEGQVCCYGEIPDAVDVDEQRPWQHPLVLIQPQWQACRINLLHGEFSPRVASGGAVKGGKAAMVAAGILSLSLLLGPRMVLAWMLVQEENHVQQEIVQVYQHYFPSLRQMTNIRYHFGQNMKKQRKGVFLQLGELEKAKQLVPAMEIDLVEYDGPQGTLTLSVSAQNPQALQEFVRQTNEHFDFTLQPVSKEAPYTAMITGKYK